MDQSWNNFYEWRGERGDVQPKFLFDEFHEISLAECASIVWNNLTAIGALLRKNEKKRTFLLWCKEEGKIQIFFQTCNLNNKNKNAMENLITRNERGFKPIYLHV